MTKEETEETPAAEPKEEEQEEKTEAPAAEETEKAEGGEADAADDKKVEEDTKEDEDAKRKREDEEGEGEEGDAKKQKTDEETKEEKPEPAPVAASLEGTTIFNDHDVLSGRGGGTNVHPGNRNFRDLINLNRRAYLKARKNDKPAISRAIVRSIRENNGRFLKKDEKSGLWFEIGDDAAREKTSQALRQRAPEMRKLLFDTEREEARAAAEEQMRQHQRMMMGMPPEMIAQMQNMPHPGMPMGPGGVPMFPNPAMMAQMQKNLPPGQQDPFAQMFAMMPMGGFPPMPPNGTPAAAKDESAAPAAKEEEDAAENAAEGEAATAEDAPAEAAATEEKVEPTEQATV